MADNLKLVNVAPVYRGLERECPFCHQEFVTGQEVVERQGGEHEDEQDMNIWMCKACARKHFDWEGEQDGETADDTPRP